MKSMTGYGTAVGKVGKGRLYVELKTINHRYFDVTLRLSPKMGSLESKLKSLLQDHLERGKAEIYIKEVEPVFGGTELVLNVSLAKQYQQAFQKLKRDLKLSGSSDFLSFVGMNPFVQTKDREGNYLQCWRPVEGLVRQALKHVDQMRRKEGTHLLADQKIRLKALQTELRKIERRSQSNTLERRQSAANQITANGSTTDKMDITEELIRLKSHAIQYAGLLRAKEPVGRKLDFLIQEMHREVNTVGAKGADVQISAAIVECKALLENLREQIQNIV